jgi:site-specific recombinase
VLFIIERNAALIERRVLTIYERLFPIWKEFDKVYQLADAKFIEEIDRVWGKFVDYKERNKMEGGEGLTSQSDEDNIGIQLRFEEFVGFEEGARGAFKSDIAVGMERYKKRVLSIVGYLKEKEGKC